MERTMFGRKIFGAVSLAALAFTAFPAQAQLVATDPSNNSVLIDLGAIDGGAAAPSYGTIGSGSRFGGMAPGAGGGQLLLPPQSAPSSRLLGPDGRALREAALPAPREERAAQPRPAAPKAAKAPSATKAEVAKAAPAARPNLPPVALPTVPAPAAPTPPKDGGPVALTTPTPPPAVTAPDIPPMQVVGPDASKAAPKAEQQAAATPQPKAAPAQPQAKAPTPAKGPTPAPSIAPPPPADTPSVAAPAAPKAAPKTEQQAALPAPRPSTGATKGGAPQNMDIVFASGTSDLSNEAKAQLDKLSESLKGDEKSRLQLLAYASEDSPSKARRLSLSRALAVRSHLIAKGIRSTRIDVRALGDQIPGGEPNRVDLQITDR